MGEFARASVEWTNVGPIASMYANVGPQVEIERKTLAAIFKCALTKKNKEISVDMNEGVIERNAANDVSKKPTKRWGQAKRCAA